MQIKYKLAHTRIVRQTFDANVWLYRVVQHSASIETLGGSLSKVLGSEIVINAWSFFTLQLPLAVGR